MDGWTECTGKKRKYIILHGDEEGVNVIKKKMKFN